MPVQKRIGETLASAGGAKKRLITDFFGKRSTHVKATIETEKKSDEVTTEETPTKKDAEPEAKVAELDPSDPYSSFCSEFKFNKQAWVESLTPKQRELLDLEINTLHITWLAALHKTLTKPYFLKLKDFVIAEQQKKTIFPPKEQIYSWSQYTPLPDIKCLILGQDPYHNFNQAHGLAFSVIEPTRPPPSLVNIYKTLKNDFPSFEIPDYNKLAKLGKPGGGNLTLWAKQGVLMLNTCLTVEAHKANSHAKRGWEQFTEEVLNAAFTYHTKEKVNGFVIMGWGTPAQKRIEKIGFNKNSKFLILNSVHPLPLSAHRGFFSSKVFQNCNRWLGENGGEKINWGIVEGNIVTE